MKEDYQKNRCILVIDDIHIVIPGLPIRSQRRPMEKTQ